VAKSCDAAKVEGFPTWIINGKKIEGEQTLEELAKLSGFQGQNDAASMVADLF
jgi:protein-disulfide isomerase